MEITYTMLGDYLIPDLTLPHQEEITLTKYSRMRKTYLKSHRKVFYNQLIGSGKLNAHLEEIDKIANWSVRQIMKRIAEQQGITEKLKATDQMAWVGAMNAIKSQAEEVVLSSDE
jgi:hypothetical protein